MSKIFFCALLVLFLSLFLTPLSLNPTHAQSSGTCSTTGTAVVQSGLVSTPDLGQNLVNSSGFCIIDPKTAFAPYKVPSFDDLKSLYYTQVKSTVRKDSIGGSPSQGDFTSKFTSNDVVLVNGDLPNLNYTGTTKPSVVFVEGNLSIGSNITYGDANSGLVFVVSDNVNISQNVTRIDAVIISEGTICTAYDVTNSRCPTTNVTASQLTINGSLISLKQPPITDPNASYIQFRRTLADNRQPAERINHQVKYLVILRNLISDTFQRWSEITGTEATPTPSPTPTPTPTPTP